VFVARIRAAQSHGRFRVIVAGRLTAIDMRRLEHACCPALASPEPKLDVDLGRVTYADQTALAILRRLEGRGVRVIRNEPVTWRTAPTRRRDGVCRQRSK
jgi:hypothetical protein